MAAFSACLFLPVIVISALVTILVVQVMSNTWFGRSACALGGSRTAAARLRVSEFRVRWRSTASVAPWLRSPECCCWGFSGGGYVDVSDPYLFATVAAVVIGGTSLLGGWGGYGATVIGSLVLTVLTSLLVG
jgi:ribose transport system permease protein